ncbi:MAG: glycosyltransferase family 2 protein [Nitrospinota bacterium]
MSTVSETSIPVTIATPRGATQSIESSRVSAKKPNPALFLFVISSWIGAVCWFHPRLSQLMDLASSPVQWGAISFFIFFVELAWLYGFYNIGVIIFATITRHTTKKIAHPVLEGTPPAVAILYTTCNDFVAESALSCVQQNYPDFKVYILDDSSDPFFMKKVDRFAELYPERVQVVRREDRKGYKAGNLNHALSKATADEPFFTLADADEVLPPDFLTKLVPRLQQDPTCGFIQANHRCNPETRNLLGKAMGDGIDIHWKWYQPLRNKFGFVMLLGHGAVLRRECWEKIGGFPEIVSEDLSYAIRIREKGWKGIFAEDVICFEDFPESIEGFRIRFMKWTRGTCELLREETGRIIRAKRISLAEKCDILFPTLNLPLSLFYFLFVIDANVVIPLLFGREAPVTLSLAGKDFVFPLYSLQQGFEVVFTYDFFIITVFTLLAPIFCFLIDLWSKPVRLFKFLCRSTAVYAALGPISSLGVFSYMITGKAKFLVTGDKSSLKAFEKEGAQKVSLYRKAVTGAKKMFLESHPNQRAVQRFEIGCGIFFSITAVLLANISFLGLAFAFALHPIMHRITWEHKATQALVFIPFIFILAGIGMGGLGLLGFQTLLFGFGFHF